MFASLMESFLVILRVGHWEIHLVYNLELRDILLIESHMGRLL